MHKVLDREGAVSRVTLTLEEWRALHRDYKVIKPERMALVMCERKGTKLVPAQITHDGLPIPETPAELPFRFPSSMIEEIAAVNHQRFVDREASAVAILRTQYGDPAKYESTDAAAQLAAFIILATERDALSAGVTQ